jgi:hypothetical protein
MLISGEKMLMFSPEMSISSEVINITQEKMLISGAKMLIFAPDRSLFAEEMRFSAPPLAPYLGTSLILSVSRSF